MSRARNLRGQWLRVELPGSYYEFSAKATPKALKTMIEVLRAGMESDPKAESDRELWDRTRALMRAGKTRLFVKWAGEGTAFEVKRELLQ